MSGTSKPKQNQGMSKKKRRRVNIMRILFIAIILMISIGMLGGSFMFML